MTEQEYLGKTYRAFIAKYGDLPVYKNFEFPDRRLWALDSNYGMWAYRLDEIDFELKFGFFSGPTCFVVHDKFSDKEQIEVFKNSRYSTECIDESMIEEYQARQWAHFNAHDYENFQENSQIITEGIIEIREYYPDNTLRRRVLIDEYTGELQYEANYTRGQYTDADSGKTRSYLKSMDRFQNGKYLHAERRKVKDRQRWVITQPRHLSGQILEQIYLKALYANRTKRPYK
jgi:hypothetical protein